ncbi:MAG: hypothetical protein DRH08_00580 [Deltaproteobacteria bacterium]|nr:MAG: hypothetical protein DRH08_00580 [Deltaproteobacteria bacterium]
MGEKQALADTKEFTGNDDLYPTEIRFVNGLNVRLACSENGQPYLQVEDSSIRLVGGLSPSALSN